METNSGGGIKMVDATETLKDAATINRIESLDKASPRSDTVDDLLQVFRDKGAEIQIGDEEVLIRFTKEALIAAGQGITSGPKNISPDN